MLYSSAEMGQPHQRLLSGFVVLFHDDSPRQAFGYGDGGRVTLSVSPLVHPSAYPPCPQTNPHAPCNARVTESASTNTLLDPSTAMATRGGDGSQPDYLLSRHAVRCILSLASSLSPSSPLLIEGCTLCASVDPTCQNRRHQTMAGMAHHRAA